MPDTYPCPCCGYRTFLHPAPGTGQNCQVCCWEDIRADGSSNGWYFDDISLDAAQVNFGRCGAYRDGAQPRTRPARSEEARSAHWATIAEHRQRLAAEISSRIDEAWRGVRRGDGVSLHQMEVIDGNGSMELLEVAAQKDPEEYWHAIDQEKLDYFAIDSWAFLNAEGFRFYIPAYLRVMLSSLTEGHETHSYYWGPWCALGGNPYSVENHYPLLSNPQRNVIATFLQVFQNFGVEHELEADRAWAQECLDNYWNRYVVQRIASPFDGGVQVSANQPELYRKVGRIG